MNSVSHPSLHTTPSPRLRRLSRSLRGFVGKLRVSFSAALVDRRLGIETSQPVDLRTLGFDVENRVEYTPSSWMTLRRVLRHIDVGPEDGFLDLGSGKGRVVLQAARWPFKRVVGVELSADLNAVARANLEASRPRLRCHDVELVEADLLHYRIPDDVTVVYAYNPVAGPVFDAAMEALIASYDRAPRRMRLLYRYPREHNRLALSGRFRLLRTHLPWRPTRGWRRGGAINVYEICPPPSAG
jgi:SAM-dependent methyltransferase